MAEVRRIKILAANGVDYPINKRFLFELRERLREKKEAEGKRYEETWYKREEPQNIWKRDRYNVREK